MEMLSLLNSLFLKVPQMSSFLLVIQTTHKFMNSHSVVYLELVLIQRNFIAAV